MKLSISNIAWQKEEDYQVYTLMQQYGFQGLEIAPTRIFPDQPYSDLSRAKKWSQELFENEGFQISSMQSIWYGREENLFRSSEERQSLLNYTKKAIDFAEAIGCGNLVFGCPRNRNLDDPSLEASAIPFFRELGDYAAEHHTVLAMEANPTIYHTNYVNDTKSAIELVQKVNSKGFRVNLDVGTMIQNQETCQLLGDHVDVINHVHISEPYLAFIEERALHKELLLLMKKEQYNGYISIEMGRQEKLQDIERAMKYLKDLAV